MSIRDKKNINVINYNDNPVCVSTRDESYAIEAAIDNAPTKIPFTFSEIETINSSSNIFRNGILRFEECDQDEIYEELKIYNWKDILTNKQIEDILLNPTYDGLKKIIEIKNTSAFERVRGIFTRLKNDEYNDISTRVERVINARYKELLRNQSKTEIILSPKVLHKNLSDEKNIQLEKQVEDLTQLVKTLLETKNDEKESVKKVDETIIEEKPKKSPTQVKKASKK